MPKAAGWDYCRTGRQSVRDLDSVPAPLGLHSPGVLLLPALLSLLLPLLLPLLLSLFLRRFIVLAILRPIRALAKARRRHDADPQRQQAPSELDSRFHVPLHLLILLC